MNDSNSVTSSTARTCIAANSATSTPRHRVPVALNGALRQTRRFTTARLAVEWAEEQRRAILAGTVEWL